MKIGEIIPLDREITLNEGKPTVTKWQTPATVRSRLAHISIFLR